MNVQILRRRLDDELFFFIIIILSFILKEISLKAVE